jgi:type I restriction enzyme R subunit
MMTDFTEDTLIEQPAVALCGQIGWQCANCFDETFGEGGRLGRETPNEVVLGSRLKPALQKFNPGFPKQALQLATAELTRERGILTPVEANRQVYELLKNQRTRAGVKVAIEEVLDRLPETFNPTLYEERVDVVYQHVYDSYFGAGKSIYLN